MATMVVFDEHALFAESLVSVLRRVGAEAVAVRTGEAVLEVLASDAVSDVVLGGDWRRGAHVETIRRVRRAGGAVRITCLTDRTADVSAGPCTEAGADLVLSKAQPLSDLVDDLRPPPGPGRHPASRFGDAQGHLAHRDGRRPASLRDLGARYLTRRELEVLRLLASGQSTRTIAEVLGISRSTTRGYVQSAFTKLGVHSRLEAVKCSLEHGLVVVPGHR